MKTLQFKALENTPEKFSDFAESALADLEACEKAPRYKINMGQWYFKDPGEPCEVCLAGAVIAQRLVVGNTPKLIDEIDFKFEVLDPATQNKLHALNLLRLGELVVAVRFYYNNDLRIFPISPGLPDLVNRKPEDVVMPGVKDFIRRMITILREAGY